MASRPPALVRAAAVCAAGLTLAACGGSSHPASATARPTRTPSPASASATPVATADDETLQVFASGVGGYELDTNPVAVLHNLAADHTATGIVVTFTVHFPGGTYTISSSPDVSLFPGQTLAVATTCNRACDDSNATSTDVAVDVGAWVPGGGTPLTVTSPTYACVNQDDVMGCPNAVDPSQGTVSATVHGTLQSLAEIVLTGVCYDASGAIVDSGFTTAFWPGGASASMTVAVLGSPSPQTSTCQLYAVAV